MGINDLVSSALSHPTTTQILILFAVAVLFQLPKRYPVLTLYAAILAAAYFITENNGGLSYFVVFMLGFANAFAEIIGKFRDEPLKAFKTSAAIAYHTLNGLISVFALYVLALNAVPMESGIDRLNAVIVAGLGSMLLMRSRLFTVRVGGEEMAFGPEQLIKVYFSFMETAIDRVRAQSRVTFVSEATKNIDFTKIYPLALTVLDSAQARDSSWKSHVTTELEKISKEADRTPQLKTMQLGFLLLTEMGEDFAGDFFATARKDSANLIAAPAIEAQDQESTDKQVQKGSDGPGQKGLAGQAVEALDKALETVGLKQKPKEKEEVNLFAYDSDLDTNTFFDKLNWTEADVSQAASRKRVETARKKANLRGFRLAFNGLRGKEVTEEGFANIVSDESGEVRGIVYRLPTEVFNFLKDNEIDYQPIQVQITTEIGTEEVANTFIAARTGENLKPSVSQLELMNRGAAGFGVDLGYTDEQTGSVTSTNSDNHDAHNKLGAKGISVQNGETTA